MGHICVTHSIHWTLMYNFWRLYLFWDTKIDICILQELKSNQFSSVTQSCLSLCNPVNCSTLKPPCPSPAPRVHPNPCPLSWWCNPTISSSVLPFSSCPQSFLASGSFQMRQPFSSRGQSSGVSASTSVLPMNTQDWSPLGWTGWICLQSKGFSRVFCNTTVQKHQFFSAQLSLWSNSHPYMTTGKTTVLTRQIFVGKVMSLLFNMLSRLFIGEGNGTPLQYSCPENPTDGEA